MLSLWKYKYFVDVVDCKSFTKAGKKNFVTQTAISQQISCLEKSMGEKLLERGNGELKLTAFGKVVYKNSKEMLAIHDRMMREIQRLQEKAILRIGVDNSVNKRLWKKLQKIVDDYYSEDEFQFQKISLNLASKLMEEDELDIYIGYELNCPDEFSEIAEVAIARNKIGIHVGENTTLPVERELKLEDLEGYCRYGTKIYPCSIQEKAVEECKKIEKETKLVSNVDTMKLKVEMNDGYMFADSYYFSYAEGDIFLLSDYDAECVLKAFYKKNDEKVNKFMKIMREVLTA